MYGKLFGFVPYELRFPTPARARERLWNRGDDRFFVPTVWGLGWSPNLRSAYRHPLQALLLATFVVWQIRRDLTG